MRAPARLPKRAARRERAISSTKATTMTKRERPISKGSISVHHHPQNHEANTDDGSQDDHHQEDGASGRVVLELTSQVGMLICSLEHCRGHTFCWKESPEA